MNIIKIIGSRTDTCVTPRSNVKKFEKNDPNVIFYKNA